MHNSNIFSAINNEYFHLTGSEKKVADYVQSHGAEVQFMSISDLSEACGVADATVSRFCRRMKLRGYSDFKLALAKAEAESNHPLPLDSPAAPSVEEDDISFRMNKVYSSNVLAMRQSIERVNPEALSRAAQLLLRANRVWCMGQGGSMILADETAHLFSTVCDKFVSISDSHRQLSHAALFRPDDVLFFLSYSGSTKEMMDVLHLAKHRGAPCIVVTRFPKSPGALLADISLQCGSDEGPLKMGSMPARMAQLLLVDILFQEFCHLDPIQTDVNRELIIDALAEKHL